MNLFNLSPRVLQMAPSETLEMGAQVRKLRESGVNVINFSLGEPDFDTPQYIKDAAVKALKEGFTKYTDPQGILPLREAICQDFSKRKLSFQPSQVLVSNGSKQALFALFQTLLQPGDEVILSVPYWVSYPAQISLCGGVPKFLSTDSRYQITKERLTKALTAKTRGIVLNSPCNPTGALLSRKSLEAVAEIVLSRNLFVISDEVYEKFVFEGEFISPMQLSPELSKRIFIVGSFSKAYAMTGWRIGFAAGDEKVIKHTAAWQGHVSSNPNSMAQKAAIVALKEEPSEIQRMIQTFRERRKVAFEEIGKLPHVSCYPAEGAFYLFPSFRSYIDGKQLKSAADLAKIFLNEAHVAVVPGGAFGAPECLRISYAADAKVIREGIQRIGQILKRFPVIS